MIACSAHPGTTRDLVVIAKGMTFVVEGGPDDPNPVIRLRAGERVRLIFKNEAPGVLHDFYIPAWNVEVERMRAGERREVTFVVPETPGRFEYRCRPHSEMMSGFVEVTR